MTQVDPRIAQQELTQNVLSTGELTGFSQIILNRAGLYEQSKRDPEAALKALHDERVRDAARWVAGWGRQESEVVLGLLFRQQARYLSADGSTQGSGVGGSL